MEKDSRIPVTIITGFLGAGKTTLLNQLIKDNAEKKFAIIENEFGEIGIDGGLIVGNDENIFELSNGCICCSLNEGFNETIKQLLESPYPFNHLLVETTGIADPDSIIKAFLSSEDIQTRFRIDSVICLADCTHLEDLLTEQAEVRKQMALADVVVLNKADTVQDSYRKELGKLIVDINPMAQIHQAQFGRVEGVDLLNLKAFSGKAVEKSTLSFKNLKFVKAPVFKQSTALTEPAQQHNHDITSIGFAIPGSFDMAKFSFWMESFLLFNRSSIFRVKGIISFADREEKLIFQAVKEDYLFESGSAWGNEDRFSKLVFIGKKLNRDIIEDSLYSLLAEPVEN